MGPSLSGSSLWEAFAWVNTPKKSRHPQNKVTNLSVNLQLPTMVVRSGYEMSARVS